VKILYAATDQTLSGFHGGTIHSLSVARQLAKRQNEVHLVYQQSSESVTAVAPVNLHAVPAHHRFLLWRTGPQVGQLLAQIQPDVVIERYYNFAGEGILRARSMNLPAVLEVNSPMLEYSGSFKNVVDKLSGGFMRKRRQKLAQNASMIVAPIREIIPPAFHEKTREIEWGADTELFDPEVLPSKNELRTRFGFTERDVLIVHFGSLRKWHGLPKLLPAFRTARKKTNRSMKLIVIGPAQKTIDEDVHFVGPVPHTELPLWLRISDFAVHPFAPEVHPYLKLGFYWSPLKVFETMAMQLPLITFKNSRLMSLLGTDDPAYYFDGTIQDLAAKILNMAQNPEAHLQEARAFRDRVVESFSWDVHGTILNNWLQELTAK
jgi:glycosyltransferase involved in cell wall biosynthesis